MNDSATLTLPRGLLKIILAFIFGGVTGGGGGLFGGKYLRTDLTEEVCVSPAEFDSLEREVFANRKLLCLLAEDAGIRSADCPQ